jgi:hypothetical protein
MRTLIDIDYVHSWAIAREIGERLRTSLKPEPGLPPSFKMQINRLHELEEHHQQSFQMRSIEKTAVERKWAGRTRRAMPSVKGHASKILNEYGKV